MPQPLDTYDGDRVDYRPLGLTLFVRRALGVANLIAAFAVAIALTINITDRVLQGAFNPSHYFHFFTIQTSIVNIVVLLVGGMFAVLRFSDPRWYAAARAAAVAYAVVVGVVYNVLLAGIAATDGYVPSTDFPNLVEHVWAPIFIALEWLVMPGRPRLRWRVLWITALYPLGWVVFSMARGLAGDGWFPYFFFNPAEVGALGVLMYVVGIAGFIIAVAAAAVSIGRLQTRVFADVGTDRA